MEKGRDRLSGVGSMTAQAETLFWRLSETHVVSSGRRCRTEDDEEENWRLLLWSGQQMLAVSSRYSTMKEKAVDFMERNSACKRHLM